jgi:OmpA-OmpF porin, OOP family
MRKLLIIVCFLQSACAFAQSPKAYNTGQGGKITLPLGDISFADKVVRYTPGKPAPQANTNPADALGVPDFNGQIVSGFVSLGTGGELVLAFTDNALVNIEGPDLYIFEVGKYIEDTYLFVSKNGKVWKNVGRIGGGSALVDIGDSTKPGEIFTFIKLQDAKTNINRNDLVWPGADIDAVAAIGSAKQLSLNSLYLFGSGESKIKSSAKKDLDAVISELKNNPDFNLTIHGHTDSIGSKQVNLKISIDRANAIKNYITAQLPQYKAKIKTEGYADEQPLVPNTSAEGREQNRRVELFFIPADTK